MKPTIHRFRVCKPHPTPTNTSSDLASPRNIRNSSPRPYSPIGLQACNRCKRLKKRCSKKLPECDLCEVAGQRCTLMQQAAVEANPQQLQAKIDRLTRYIDENMPDLETGPDIRKDAVQHSDMLGQGMDVASPDLDQVEYTVRDHASQGAPSIVFARAYFRHVHRAYPFLDKSKVLQDTSQLSSLDLWRGDLKSMKLGLIMAIGSTTLERAGKVSADTRMNVEVSYSDILGQCLLSPSMDSLQILTLLALYSLFDPKGVATWSIVGILTRQAASLGLTRKSTERIGLLSYDEELRHRLLWSIFVLDRMVAVSIGQSVGLVDENMNTPQPAITVEEFASPDRVELASLLQLNRHIIQLRQLEQGILSTIYLPNAAEVSKMAAVDRTNIVEQQRSRIEHWYSQGCLVSLPEPDNIPIHNTITWLNARYYNLLILLYYPCHFNSQSQYTQGEDLLDFITKYIHYSRILFENRQLPLNHITLNRFLPLCLALLYCFGISRRCDYNFAGRSDLIGVINILRQFTHSWKPAHQAASIMEEFGDLVASHEGTSSTLLVRSTFSNEIPFQRTTKTWLKVLQKKLIQTIGETMGKSSTYLYVADWDSKQEKADALLKLPGQDVTTPTNLDSSSWNFTDNFELGFV